MKIEILVGQPALNLINNNQFLERWERLYQTCCWATAYQSPGFVTSWYRLYEKEYAIILVTGYTSNELAGLIALAVRKGCTKIVAAGDVQATYQVWLAFPDSNTEFISTAVKKIFERFNKHTLAFKYLPPGIDLQWLNPVKQPKLYIRSKSHNRPIMEIDSNKMQEQLRKKNNRYNLNRLKKRGEVVFERISSEEDFSKILDSYISIYDFRRGAMFNALPFKEDRQKKAFYIELFKQKLLHTTVLKCGNEIVSVNIGMCSQKVVHSGLTHSTFFAKYSPGTLHRALLGSLLANDGVSIFDLTPGGDHYKELFATSHDTVSELYIHDRRSEYLADAIISSTYHAIKSFFKNAGIPTHRVKAKVHWIRHLGLINIIRLLLSHLTKSDKRLFFKGDIQNIKRSEISLPSSSTVIININDLHHLTAYSWTSESYLQTKQKFLMNAMNRISENMHFLTVIKDEEPQVCVWFSKIGYEKDSLNKNGIQQTIVINELACYNNRLFNENFKEFLPLIVNKLVQTTKPQEIIMILPRLRKEEVRAITDLGLQPCNPTRSSL